MNFPVVAVNRLAFQAIQSYFAVAGTEGRGEHYLLGPGCSSSSSCRRFLRYSGPNCKNHRPGKTAIILSQRFHSELIRFCPKSRSGSEGAGVSWGDAETVLGTVGGGPLHWHLCLLG